MFFSFFRRRLSLVLVWLMIPGLLLAQGPDRDRYIVSLIEDGPGRAALRAAGARIELELPSLGAVAAKIPARALPGLMCNPTIEYIEQDVPRYPMAQTVPYGIPMVQADLAAYDGPSGVKVCIIDSGYHLGHEDLPNGSMVTGKSDSGAGDWFQDGHGHGTHVAGTIAALTNKVGVVGVASHGNIPLHIVRVFGDNGNWAYSSTLIAALDACEAAGANIVNMSLGGSFKSFSEDRAFGAAYNRGILSIAAAGNAGNTRKSYPASYNSVMSVAAIDATMTVADFSQQNDQVEVAAPGVAVRSTVPMGTGTTERFVLDGNSYESHLRTPPVGRLQALSSTAA
jgi:subtilisin family serine protease